MVLLPSFQDGAKIQFIEECTRQLPSVPVLYVPDCCHTGSVDISSTLTSSSFPLLLLFGSPPEPRKAVSNVLPVTFDFLSEVPSSQSPMAKALLTITPAVLLQATASKRYQIPVTVERVSYSELPHDAHLTVLVETVNQDDVVPGPLEVDTRIVQSVFNQVVRDSEPYPGFVTPNIIKDALSLQ
eukprot:TRINITY_DN21389_c0_g1_i1.p1 TRINITY_DN21389_c0_g1~~TRINITY_DN21389_c0_g1_i1.p1  ORF type:complete len:184 (+),score=21.77 TRINITY_DN21389_c0_g1_i1:228-779(+)